MSFNIYIYIYTYIYNDQISIGKDDEQHRPKFRLWKRPHATMIKCKIEHRLLDMIVMLARLFKTINGPIKPPERLFKNKSFSVAVCSDWMLYGTWVLIKKVKKMKTAKKCQASYFFTEVAKFIRKFLPRLITKVLSISSN